MVLDIERDCPCDVDERLKEFEQIHCGGEHCHKCWAAALRSIKIEIVEVVK